MVYFSAFVFFFHQYRSSALLNREMMKPQAVKNVTESRWCICIQCCMQCLHNRLILFFCLLFPLFLAHYITHGAASHGTACRFCLRRRAFPEWSFFDSFLDCCCQLCSMCLDYCWDPILIEKTWLSEGYSSMQTPSWFCRDTVVVFKQSPLSKSQLLRKFWPLQCFKGFWRHIFLFLRAVILLF